VTWSLESLRFSFSVPSPLSTRSRIWVTSLIVGLWRTSYMYGAGLKTPFSWQSRPLAIADRAIRPTHFPGFTLQSTTSLFHQRPGPPSRRTRQPASQSSGPGPAPLGASAGPTHLRSRRTVGNLPRTPHRQSSESSSSPGMSSNADDNRTRLITGGDPWRNLNTAFPSVRE